MAHGKIKEFDRHVTWDVPYFRDLPLKSGYFVVSPKFQLSGGTWCLRVFPYNEVRWRYYTKIWLVKLASSPQKQEYCCRMSYLDTEGRKQKLSSGGDTREFVGEYKLGKGKFSGCMFEMERPEKLPKNILTVVCRVFPIGLSCDTTSLITTRHSASQTDWPAPAVPGQPSCRKETPKESPGLQKLKSDYKKLLESGAEGDLLVVVSDRELRAHKCILRARSTVFDAMFEHETREKESGKIVIEDLDPDTFRTFLEHLYTGDVEVFSEENVFELYTAADKYDVQELKSEAVRYMQSHLSLQSFCDVMSLALQHQEHDLMDRATDFLKNNSSKILETEKWRTFMKENCATANELFMKVLVGEKK